MILFVVLHLFITLAFGAVLVVNCGKKKEEEAKFKEDVKKNLILPRLEKEAKERCEKEEENRKRREEAAERKKKWDEEDKKRAEEAKIRKIEQRKKRDKDHKERLGKDNDEIKEAWEKCKDYLKTCNYFDEYSACDLAFRLRMAYNRIRQLCHELANRDMQTNIKYWCLYEHDIGTKIYMPYFREMKTKFQEKHREHLDQKGIDEILDVFNQIENDFELVVEAKKKYEKEDRGEEITEYSIRNCKFKNSEPWMKPSWHDEYRKEVPFSHSVTLPRKSAWNGRKDIDEIIKTCHKKIHGGQCDFIGRGNFFIGQWRNHAQDDPPFSKKGMCKPEYEDCEMYDECEPEEKDIIKYEVEISDIYMKKVDEAKEKHREHLKNPKELDDWFQLHKNKTKELKEKYEACKKDEKDWSQGEWKKLVGYKNLPVVVPLPEDK